MIARSVSFVRESGGPLALLFVGLTLTAGWIGLLGYGFLRLIGY
jgi:hypothetical protein